MKNNTHTVTTLEDLLTIAIPRIRDDIQGRSSHKKRLTTNLLLGAFTYIAHATITGQPTTTNDLVPHVFVDRTSANRVTDHLIALELLEAHTIKSAKSRSIKEYRIAEALIEDAQRAHRRAPSSLRRSQ